jgi:centromere protein C
MPTSAHKTRVIPRRDNPDVSKKTGIAVPHVQSNSDEFEPFEEIMRQANSRILPKPKGWKGQPTAHTQEAGLDEEDGEMPVTKDLDDSKSLSH